MRDFVSQRKKNRSRVSLHQTIEKVMCHASYDVPFSYMRTLFISWRSLNLQSLFSEDCSKSRLLWGGERTTRTKTRSDRPKLSASTIAEVAWQMEGVPWGNINIIHSSSCSQIRRKPFFFFQLGKLCLSTWFRIHWRTRLASSEENSNHFFISSVSKVTQEE